MFDVEYADELGPASWKRTKYGVVWMKCVNGHIGSLADHDVDERGVVDPSVECPTKSCGFHETVRLIGWDGAE